MKRLLLLCCFSAGLCASGQSSFKYKDDFKTILGKTKDAKSSLAYGKLLKRFTSNDTTLSNYEVLALLIGYTGKMDFRPYSDLGTEREIYKLNGENKYQEGLTLANTFLKTHPVSVKAIFEKSYAFYKLGQADSSHYYMRQGRRIFEAMEFSGSGQSSETPMFALGPADGQDYIRKYLAASIGTMGSASDSDGHFLDVLEAKFKDGHSTTMYFIIQHATDTMFDK